ncbi:MAG: DUF3810 domain-containing protein [Ferruginibacter sp.]
MMQFVKKYWKWELLILLTIIIKLFSLNHRLVEIYYSKGFYPGFSKLLRFLFGWLPFSAGDIFYGVLTIWILVRITKAIVALFNRKVTRAAFGKGISHTFMFLLTMYVIFNIFWGINYDRQNIAVQLELKQDSFNLQNLKDINRLLVEKVNTAKQSLVNNNTVYPDNAHLFKMVAAAYDEAAKQYPFLDYHPVSLKSSLWGWIGNYTGFSGYYNPFSGEAQVNTNVPRFVLPFTSCHEVGHQLGFAKENEASFVGYLAAAASKDTLFHYSVYLDLFLYANRTLALNGFLQHDTAIAKFYKDQLIQPVKNDLAELQKFYDRHRNPVEPWVRKGYAFYLRRNQQPHGLRSYDEVTDFIIAYYKKYGKI